MNLVKLPLSVLSYVVDLVESGYESRFSMNSGGSPHYNPIPGCSLEDRHFNL